MRICTIFRGGTFIFTYVDRAALRGRRPRRHNHAPRAPRTEPLRRTPHANTHTPSPAPQPQPLRRWTDRRAASAVPPSYFFSSHNSFSPPSLKLQNVPLINASNRLTDAALGRSSIATSCDAAPSRLGRLGRGPQFHLGEIVELIICGSGNTARWLAYISTAAQDAQMYSLRAAAHWQDWQVGWWVLSCEGTRRRGSPQEQGRFCIVWQWIRIVRRLCRQHVWFCTMEVTLSLLLSHTVSPPPRGEEARKA